MATQETNDKAKLIVDAYRECDNRAAFINVMVNEKIDRVDTEFVWELIDYIFDTEDLK